MDMDTENRIVTPDLSPEDTDLEFSLRPRQLTDYIGQDKAKENLRSISRPPAAEATASTMFCFTASRTRQNDPRGHNSE